MPFLALSYVTFKPGMRIRLGGWAPLINTPHNRFPFKVNVFFIESKHPYWWLSLRRRENFLNNEDPCKGGSIFIFFCGCRCGLYRYNCFYVAQFLCAMYVAMCPLDWGEIHQDDTRYVPGLKSVAYVSMTIVKDYTLRVYLVQLSWCICDLLMREKDLFQHTMYMWFTETVGWSRVDRQEFVWDLSLQFNFDSAFVSPKRWDQTRMRSNRREFIIPSEPKFSLTFIKI